MIFFNVKRNEEDVSDTGGGNYINSSGMYEVLVKNAIYSVNTTGSESIDLFIEYNSQTQILFNAFRLKNKDGSPNIIGQKSFNKFCIVTESSDTIAEPQPTTLPIGKSKKEIDVRILPDFCDVSVILAIKFEYALYNGEIQEQKVVRSCFNANTSASASEIVNNSTDLKQYNKELATIEKPVYKDGLTAEVITEWIANGRNGKKEKIEPKKPTEGFSGNRFAAKNK